MKHNSKQSDEDKELGWFFKEPCADWTEEEQLEYFRLEQRAIQKQETQKQKNRKHKH